MKHFINRCTWLKTSAMVAGALVLGHRVYPEYTDTLLASSFTPSTMPPLDFNNM